MLPETGNISTVSAILTRVLRVPRKAIYPPLDIIWDEITGRFREPKLSYFSLSHTLAGSGGLPTGEHSGAVM